MALFFIGKWLDFLDAVPNATATKHVKDLKAILEMCFFSNQSLLLKPEGPLSLRDFQQLRSSQSKTCHFILSFSTYVI